jgi:hypothetical protein
MLYSVVIGYQCFGGPCCLQFQAEVNGAEKGGIDIGREYKSQWSPTASRKWDSDTNSRRGAMWCSNLSETPLHSYTPIQACSQSARIQLFTGLSVLVSTSPIHHITPLLPLVPLSFSAS